MTALQPIETPQKKKLSKLSIVGLIFAIFLAPIGVILSVIALVRISKYHLGGSGLAILGIVIGAVLSAPIFLIAYALYGPYGWFAPNKALSDATPIIASMKSLGGQKICETSYNGNGPDESRAYYDGYYSLPNSNHVVKDVKDSFEKLGYTLHTDKGQTDPLLSLADPSQAPKTNDVEQEGINDVLYIVEAKNWSGEVRIYRDMVNYECEEGLPLDQYGETVPVPSGRAVVLFGVNPR